MQFRTATKVCACGRVIISEFVCECIYIYVCERGPNTQREKLCVKVWVFVHDCVCGLERQKETEMKTWCMRGCESTCVGYCVFGGVCDVCYLVLLNWYRGRWSCAYVTASWLTWQINKNRMQKWTKNQKQTGSFLDCSRNRTRNLSLRIECPWWNSQIHLFVWSPCSIYKSLNCVRQPGRGVKELKKGSGSWLGIKHPVIETT